MDYNGTHEIAKIFILLTEKQLQNNQQPHHPLQHVGISWRTYKDHCNNLLQAPILTCAVMHAATLT